MAKRPKKSNKIDAQKLFILIHADDLTDFVEDENVYTDKDAAFVGAKQLAIDYTNSGQHEAYIFRCIGVVKKLPPKEPEVEVSDFETGMHGKG